MKFLFISLFIAVGYLYAPAQSTFKSNLPVKPGKGVTVAGIVECGGKPVQGVRVSDGYEITKTDKRGAYYLKSNKQNPQVFIINPSGYETWREDVVPQFWAELSAPANEYERHDFRLKKVDNTRHGLILITDTHFHGKRRDEATFAKYADVIKREANKFSERDIPVYSLNLGDISYDNYWYETGVTPARIRDIFNENNWPAPLYSVMGNHDNDGAVCAGDSTDLLGAVTYMKAYGPRYYSANFGKIHYIMLDNIEFFNEPGNGPYNEGIKGKRNYKTRFTPEQLEWLRKDLEDIPAETPLLIAMHCPLHQYKKGTMDIKIVPEEESALQLKRILEPYKNIHVVSGHTHRNGLVRLPENGRTFIDHNILSTSGSIWWNSSFNQKNIAFDGAPVGFEVFDIAGDNIEWRFVPYEYPADRQFDAWDINSLKHFFSTDTEAKTMRKYLPKWGAYEKYPENAVLIQVWDYDPAGKLTVIENNHELSPQLVYEVHPEYYAMTAIQKGEWAGDYKKGLREPKRSRMFVVETSAPDTPVGITYIDAFGREDRRTLTRPLPFNSNPLPSDTL